MKGCKQRLQGDIRWNHSILNSIESFEKYKEERKNKSVCLIYEEINESPIEKSSSANITKDVSAKTNLNMLKNLIGYIQCGNKGRTKTYLWPLMVWEFGNQIWYFDGLRCF